MKRFLLSIMLVLAFGVYTITMSGCKQASAASTMNAPPAKQKVISYDIITDNSKYHTSVYTRDSINNCIKFKAKISSCGCNDEVKEIEVCGSYHILKNEDLE